MDKTSKILVTVLGLLAAMLFVIYCFLSVVNSSIPKPLEYPESGLSQSIFDSQNVKYTPNEAYTTQHVFYRCPYMVDIADTDSAKVSDYGNVYEISDSMYFYITEFKKDENIETVLRNELSQAVMVDSNTAMTAVDNLVYDEGYLNGFKADYYIDCMTVTNGNRAASVYITGYVLTITNTDYDHGYKMFVGVMASGNDTETYANGKAIVDSVINTYQVNESIQSELVAEEEAAIAAEEKARKEAEERGETYVPSTSVASGENDSLVVSTDGSTTDLASSANVAQPNDVNSSGTPQNSYIRDDAYINNNSSAGTGAAANANIPAQKTKSMTLSEEYTNVTLYYYYENKDNEITVTLSNPDGTQTYQPTSSAEGTIIFKLDRMEAGKWQVLISGNAGTDSMKLYSDSMSDTPESGNTSETASEGSAQTESSD